MKRLFLNTVVIFPLILGGCITCDCASETQFQFRIVDSETNKDLVFGPDKIYNSNEIMLNSYSGVHVDLQPFETSTGDSAFVGSLAQGGDYIIDLGETNKGINIIQGSQKGGCCEGASKFEQVIIDNISISKSTEENLFILLF